MSQGKHSLPAERGGLETLPQSRLVAASDFNCDHCALQTHTPLGA